METLQKEQFEKIDEYLLVKETEMQSVLSQLQEKENELRSLKKTYDELVDFVSLDTQVVEVIKLLFDKSTTQGFTFLEKLVTVALKTVFDDRDYEFVIHINDRGGEKALEFFLKDSGQLRPLKDAVGGGIQAIISLVFRVYFIIRTGMRRLLVFDESFAMLSEQYQDKLLEFMRMIVDKFGFKILWITHNPWLKSEIRPAYEVMDGRVRRIA